MIIGEKQKQTCIAALRFAAVQNAKDARLCRETPRVAEQFLRQSNEAGELADLMESRIEEALS